jgi:hypothetical protein
MKKSYYFAELATSYDAEIQDLLSDSEGKSVLKARLKEKRSELHGILPMIAFSPEMVVPVFYDAFTFSNPKALAAAILCEPDDGDFPSWPDLSAAINLAPWANTYLSAVLGESTGEEFMVTAACLEFIRQFDNSGTPSADEEEDAKREKNADEDGEDDEMDLAEAGDDWMAEQGFDSFKS